MYSLRNIPLDWETAGLIISGRSMYALMFATFIRAHIWQHGRILVGGPGAAWGLLFVFGLAVIVLRSRLPHSVVTWV